MTVLRFASSPLFTIGLAVRLLLIAFVHPSAEQKMLTDVMETALRHGGFDPWSSGGFFAYGPMVFMVFMPFSAVGMGMNTLLGTPAFSSYAYRLPLLLFDVLGLWAVQRFVQKRDAATWVYWMSPLSLLVTYWYGLPEIIPVALALTALQWLKRNEMRASGILLGLGVAAQPFMLAMVPIVYTYFWQNKRLRSGLADFSAWLLSSMAASLIPFALFAPGLRAYGLEMPRLVGQLGFSLNLTHEIGIYIVPMVYLMFLYGMWRLRRSSFEVFFTIVGMMIISCALLSPSIPEGYIWALPFLAFYASKTTRIGMGIVQAFVILLTALLFFANPFQANQVGPAWQMSGLMTLIAALGMVIVMRMYSEGVKYNAYHRVSRRPLVLGIAGGYGMGKRTLAGALRDLFGSHSTTLVSGDAYQKWDRNSPMWRAVSRFNPKANELSLMTRDVISIVTGETVFRRPYNPKTGRFMRPSPILPNDIVIVSGLHALFQPHLREKLDVKIFLNADSSLARYWAMHGKNQTESDQGDDAHKRDIESYIAPQAQHADLVFDLMPVNLSHTEDGARTTEIPLKLHVRLRDALYYESLIKTLIGICGLQIDWDMTDEGRLVDFTVEGDVSAEDIHLAAASMVPGLDDMLDITFMWQHDMLGVMQLITLIHIDQTLRRRILE